MDHTILIIKTCLMGGLLLLIFFGLFFRLLQAWFFRRRISSAVVTGKYPVSHDGNAEKKGGAAEFVLHVEAEEGSLSLRCPGQLYENFRVGDTVSLVCRGSRVQEMTHITQ